MRLIYDYTSFGTFLKEYYLSQKKKVPSYSYAAFAKQVGLSSSAHIQLIISGKRNITVHNIHRMAEALSLPKRELEYFEALVHENQAESPTEKKFYQERLRELRLEKPSSSARLKISFLLSKGILPALLLSVEGKDLATASRSGDRFGYTHQETERILEQLMKEGIIFLSAAETGQTARIRLSQRHLILHDKRNQSQAQKSYLAEQLHLSAQAFQRMYEKEAKFFAHTFTIRPVDLERYISEVKGVIERLTRLSDEEAGDTVMQLNMQLFPYEKKLLGAERTSL